MIHFLQVLVNGASIIHFLQALANGAFMIHFLEASANGASMIHLVMCFRFWGNKGKARLPQVIMTPVQTK